MSRRAARRERERQRHVWIDERIPRCQRCSRPAQVLEEDGSSWCEGHWRQIACEGHAS